MVCCRGDRWLGDSKSETYSSQASEFVDAENVPAWHASHVDEPGSGENRPGSHAVHSDWPAAAADLPASQLWHALELSNNEDMPTWHASHVDEPGSGENRPASHAEHNFWPYADDLPASQITQPSVPAFSPASFVEARPASLWCTGDGGLWRKN